MAKENALQAAVEQLEHLEKERQGALEQYQVGRPWSLADPLFFISLGEMRCAMHPPAARWHHRAAQ